jgi:myo-inositol-1(or 4)-monophosphatase
VSKRDNLGDCLLGTGFPFRQLGHLDEYVQIFKRLTQNSAGVRRPGAASLDLAYVAAGRLDGFWEIGLSPWDIAGGSLLIIEAGGMIGEMYGNGDYLATGNVVCGAPKIYDQMIELIRETRAAPGRAS